MAAGCQTQLNYLADNIGTYRVSIASSAGANTTVTASTANGTPAILVGAMCLANGANASVGPSIVIYDGAVGAGNIVYTLANNTDLNKLQTINVPLVNGCLTIAAGANCPQAWFSYLGTDTGGR